MKDAPLDIGDDDGFASIKIGDVEKRIDLMEIYDRLAVLNQETAGDREGGYVAGIKEILSDCGFPECSNRVALRFAKRITEAGAGYLKKDGLVTGSGVALPLTTDSTPEDGEPETYTDSTSKLTDSEPPIPSENTAAV